MSRGFRGFLLELGVAVTVIPALACLLGTLAFIATRP